MGKDSEEINEELKPADSSIIIETVGKKTKYSFSSYPPLTFHRFELRDILDDNIEELRAQKKPIIPTIGLATSLLGILIAIFYQVNDFTKFMSNIINVLLILILICVIIFLGYRIYSNSNIKSMTVRELMGILIEESDKKINEVVNE